MENIIENPREFSFASIDDQVRRLDLADIRCNSLLAVQGSRIQRLVTIYRGVRPLLKAVAVLAILPPYWRAAVELLTGTLDEIASSTPFAVTQEVALPQEQEQESDSTFKAGKDL
jgi:hypothetical protein